MRHNKFPTGLSERMNYYVYVYSDPDDGKIFYIGKGKDNRCFDHLKCQEECGKTDKIKEIQSRGKEPIIHILARNLSEKEAYDIEAACISILGISDLTNRSFGTPVSDIGLVDTEDIIDSFQNNVISVHDLKHNVIVLRMNDEYFNGEAGHDLYEIARTDWTLRGEKKQNDAKKAEYALVTYKNWIVGVYKIAAWFPTNTTRVTDNPIGSAGKNSFEFVGCEAEDTVYDYYHMKCLDDSFKNDASFIYLLH